MAATVSPSRNARRDSSRHGTAIPLTHRRVFFSGSLITPHIRQPLQAPPLPRPNGVILHKLRSNPVIHNRDPSLLLPQVNQDDGDDVEGGTRCWEELLDWRSAETLRSLVAQAHPHHTRFHHHSSTPPRHQAEEREKDAKRLAVYDLLVRSADSRTPSRSGVGGWGPSLSSVVDHHPAAYASDDVPLVFSLSRRDRSSGGAGRVIRRQPKCTVRRPEESIVSLSMSHLGGSSPPSPPPKKSRVTHTTPMVMVTNKASQPEASKPLGPAALSKTAPKKTNASLNDAPRPWTPLPSEDEGDEHRLYVSGLDADNVSSVTLTGGEGEEPSSLSDSVHRHPWMAEGEHAEHNDYVTAEETSMDRVAKEAFLMSMCLEVMTSKAAHAVRARYWRMWMTRRSSEGHRRRTLNSQCEAQQGGKATTTHEDTGLLSPSVVKRGDIMIPLSRIQRRMECRLVLHYYLMWKRRCVMTHYCSPSRRESSLVSKESEPQHCVACTTAVVAVAITSPSLVLTKQRAASMGEMKLRRLLLRYYVTWRQYLRRCKQRQRSQQRAATLQMPRVESQIGRSGEDCLPLTTCAEATSMQPTATIVETLDEGNVVTAPFGNALGDAPSATAAATCNHSPDPRFASPHRREDDDQASPTTVWYTPESTHKKRDEESLHGEEVLCEDEEGGCRVQRSLGVDDEGIVMQQHVGGIADTQQHRVGEEAEEEDALFMDTTLHNQEGRLYPEVELTANPSVVFGSSSLTLTMSMTFPQKSSISDVPQQQHPCGDEAADAPLSQSARHVFDESLHDDASCEHEEGRVVHRIRYFHGEL